MCVKMAITKLFAVDPTANSKQGQLMSNCTAVCVHNFRPLLIFYHIRIVWQSLSTKHRTISLTHQTGNYPGTCFVSRQSGITLVDFHSLQVAIKTNLLAEPKAPNTELNI